ncbi:hypothetical protein [Candidatus Mycoplasma haematohominis]|uniref:hypothetical protein n=1 Tax=Candidatus Mycoplasma haematohominis TaxID=1494318 RepID=UPI001C0A70D9|nr:hypothetical protein [Candidatus Mycoplasma haemohominis]
MPKLGSSLIAGGILGTGGFAAYNNTVPKNIQAALEREGIPFIDSISDTNEKNRAYKAVYIDNKSNIKEDIAAIKQDTEDAAYSEIDTWCNQQLNAPYSWSTLEKNREKIINYCSDQRPKTVEGRLKRITEGIWIRDQKQNKEEAYKVIFAIYRYDDDFLKQINSVKGNGNDYDHSEDANTGYERLQKWCEEKLSSKVSLVEDENLYNYVFWWCKKLDHGATVRDKIKHDYPGWNEENKDWTKVKGYWQMTRQVYVWIDENSKKSINGSNIDSIKYQTWCENTLKAKIYDSQIYQWKYLIAKSVCVEVKVQAVLGKYKNLKEAIANKDNTD